MKKLFAGKALLGVWCFSYYVVSREICKFVHVHDLRSLIGSWVVRHVAAKATQRAARRRAGPDPV